MSVVTNVTFESGYITLHMDSGQPVKHDIASVLRALDIPTGITYKQVAAISALVNLMAIVIRTLIEREILDESFIDSLGLDMSLEGIIEAIEAMGGSYGSPTLEDADE